MVTLTEEQVNHLVAGVAGDWFEALYVLAVTTGMRAGELLGLRWQDIDIERGSLLVRGGVSEGEGGLVLAETKTAHSRCRIALAHVALDALWVHRLRQNERRLAIEAIWDGSLDLVFPNTLGRLMNPSDLRGKKRFKAHLQRLGLPEMRFHDLRHTCATLLLSRGGNIKIVSEMLGHADIGTTLRVYGHILPHMQDIAAREMVAIFLLF
jgi:integrase